MTAPEGGQQGKEAHSSPHLEPPSQHRSRVIAIPQTHGQAAQSMGTYLQPTFTSASWKLHPAVSLRDTPGDIFQPPPSETSEPTHILTQQFTGKMQIHQRCHFHQQSKGLGAKEGHAINSSCLDINNSGSAARGAGCWLGRWCGGETP